MTTHLVISTHNINGFERHADFLRARCENESNTVQCIQEHWLRPPFKKIKGENKLQHVHKDFDGYGTSAMKKSMQEKVRLGRPFGGTGFLWHKKFSRFISPRTDLKHERVSVLELNSSYGKILCLNVYFPYLDYSKIDTQKAILCETIGFIDHILDNNSFSSFIIAGDLNCNIFDNTHPFTPLIRDLMKRRSLLCSFDLIDGFNHNTAWTRSNFGNNNGVNSTSLIDFILISDCLKDLVSKVEICDVPGNLSDHVPVSVHFKLDFDDMLQKSNSNLPSSVNWSNLNSDVLEHYSDVMETALASIQIPFHSLLHGNCSCDNSDHVFLIEKYFCDIVAAIETADKCLPRVKPGISKSYWNNELSDLKTASFEAFQLWRDSGKPLSGPIFDLKKKSHYRYKYAIRNAKRRFDQNLCDSIHLDLLNKDSNGFWKAWKSVHGNGKDESVRVNGKFNDIDIANEFASNFQKVYEEANSEQAKRLSYEFRSLYSDYFDSHKTDDLYSAYLSWDNMLEIMSKLKAGKASGSAIKAEHVLHGTPLLVIHLQLLFNSMIQHSYVPTAFLKGVITPIVKDAEGDLSSPDNYRGITLSHVFSFLFDHAILLKIDHLLLTDDLQFGYKKKHSCNHAIFTVKKCINYFRDHGSRVYASFLDCTKGFDRVSHDGLFIKLLKRNVPLCWLRIFMYWYSNMFSVCKWNDTFSFSFPVISGVRQGGVLSAKFWAVYMNDLFLQLKSTKKGCYIFHRFIACILYADDVCLLAPTRKAMQCLLDTCSEYAQSWCIRYNANKTKMMYFGEDFNSLTCGPLSLNDKNLEYVTEWKYLGVMVKSNKNFSTSVLKPRSAFYRSSNSILNVLNGPSEDVQMRLLYSICVPCLTYACDVVDYSCKDKQSLHVALNDAIRKIFGYNRWQSIKDIRESFGFLSVTEIFAKRKSKFELSLPHSGNSLLTFLLNT